MIAHELVKSTGRRVFSEDMECLAESYVRGKEFEKAETELMQVNGGGMREMVYVKHVTKSGDIYWFADKTTGTLYHPETGRCKSSGELTLVLPK